MSDKYRMIGPLYDILATIFSFGQIDRCKCGMHDRIRPDMEVLFAGVGQGIDAIEAASLGAQVTVVDLSETMLTVFRTRVQGRYFIHPIRIVHADIFTFEEFDRYDMVFANFFLNVFPRDMVLKLEEHLARLVRPGGISLSGISLSLREASWPGLCRMSTGTLQTSCSTSWPATHCILSTIIPRT